MNGLRDRVAQAPDPALRAAWAKLKGGMFRIALVMHLVEWVSGWEGDTLDPVPESTMRNAITITDWFAQEAELVYGMLAEDEQEQATRELVGWIQRRSGSVTPRDLSHGRSGHRGDSQLAERHLQALVDADLGVWQQQPPGRKGGAPTKRFRLYHGNTIAKTLSDGTGVGGSGDGDAGK